MSDELWIPVRNAGEHPAYAALRDHWRKVSRMSALERATYEREMARRRGVIAEDVTRETWSDEARAAYAGFDAVLPNFRPLDQVDWRGLRPAISRLIDESPADPLTDDDANWGES